MSAPQFTPPERIVRLTVDRLKSLHQKLSETVTRLKRKKAVAVRMALEQALKDLNHDAVVGQDCSGWQKSGDADRAMLSMF